MAATGHISVGIQTTCITHCSQSRVTGLQKERLPSLQEACEVPMGGEDGKGGREDDSAQAKSRHGPRVDHTHFERHSQGQGTITTTSTIRNGDWHTWRLSIWVNQD